MNADVRILYRDENMVAFYKPAGMHVHPHENPIHRVHRSQVLLYQARDMVEQYVYPVHRLDAGTSGVILFGLSGAAAGQIAKLIQSQQIEKTYETVVRGWVKDSGRMDVPLELDSTNVPVDSVTDFERLKTIEINEPVGKRHATARYSLVRAWPRTGRFHQIRRHFARSSHPVLGDCEHGDSKHNQFFRTKVEIAGLCLRASELRLQAPWNEAPVHITAPPCEKWVKIHQLFQFS